MNLRENFATMVLMSRRLKAIISHYFIPHESNNFKAKTLHIKSIVFYIVLLAILQTFNSLLRYIEPNVLGYATDITVEKIVLLVNQERINNQLSPLSLSPELSTAATQKAADMFTKNYWAHISPTGVSPWQFISSSGYSYIYAGENLAKSFNTSEEVVKAWMNSSTHKANILKPEYKDIGISVMNGLLNGEETTLVVEEFGTPVEKVIASVQKSPDMENQSNNIAESVKEREMIAGMQSQIVQNIPRTLSLVIAEIMLILLVIDSIFIWRHKTIRISSHSLAHIIFIVSLVIAMGATGMGVIL